MTEISKSSEQSLNNILNKLGVKTQDEAQKPANKNSLGQEDFLKLMTTQLQNQDPFAPMDNGDFIAQMAQFSTVTGITEINSNLTNLGSKLEPNRVATAAQFLGHSVLVPGQVVSPDDKGEIHGVVDLPAYSNDVGLTFTNPSGEIVHSINLGSQEKGLVGFSWENIPDEIKKNKTRLTIQAYAGNGEASDGISTAVYNKVIAASAPKNSEDVILETKDYGEISANDAIKLKTND
ncbi:MAG: flagellar biosynthesis protein FlgJ [alpha proteobacterium MED-G10]|jgi:flagellar basal-body rod modification protein FlgD|nr:MAG: flagellar biosynthesis protein FlgJ [alpha proteobacterium MED-G10]|tara:strand:+ start:1665 stop:2369 length:705 start_codon:yes stop_codon:yes gene_type:complete